MTTPSNICRRSLSPSLMRTWTRTVSPAPKVGTSACWVFARSFSMMAEFGILLFLGAEARFLFAPDPGDQNSIFFAERRLLEQIGTVPQGLAQRRPPPPAANLFMVPGHQHLGNRQAAKLGGPGVMRIIEQSAGCAGGTRLACFFRSRGRTERLLPRRGFVAQGAGEQARNGVNNHR